MLQAADLIPQGQPVFKVHCVPKSHLAACVAADCSFSQSLQALPLAESVIHLLLFSSPSLECGLLPSPTLGSALHTQHISSPYKYCLLLLPLAPRPSYPIHCQCGLLNLFPVQDCFCWNGLVDPLEWHKDIIAKYDLFFAYQKKGKSDVPKAY